MANVVQALVKAQEWIGTIPGVVAVGEGRKDDGSPTVDVWVTQSVNLPQEVGGIEVRVRQTGSFDAQ